MPSVSSDWLTLSRLVGIRVILEVMLKCPSLCLELCSPFTRYKPVAGDPERAVHPLLQWGEGDVHLLPEHRDLKTNLDFLCLLTCYGYCRHLLWPQHCL